jgi:hypothetical protein
MPRTALSQNVNDGPSATGGPSPWLLIAIMVVSIGAIEHFARRTPKGSAITGTNAVIKTSSAPAKTASAPAIVSRYEKFPRAFLEDPHADRLAGLVRDFAKETDPDKREDLLTAWAAEIKTDDIPSWLNFLQSASPSDLAQNLSQRLLRHWTGVTPEEASAWLGLLPSDRQLALLDAVAVPWANGNPTNAMNWASSLPDDAVHRQALATVAGEVIRSQPLIALKMAIDLPAGPQQDDLIRRGAMQWASEDADSAVAWIKEIPASDLRNQAMSGAAMVWSASEPVTAANLAVDELPPGRLLDDTVIAIVQRWAQKDPVAAAAWVEQFPAGPLRDTAIENLRAQIQRQLEETSSTEAGTRQM